MLVPLTALAIWLLAATGHAQEVTLQAPLSTVVPIALGEAPPHALNVILRVPDDAPTDLGIGAFLADDDGTWYQRLHPSVLGPGRHEIHFDLGPSARLVGEPHRGVWNPFRHAISQRCGLFLWSAGNSRARVVIAGIEQIGGNGNGNGNGNSNGLANSPPAGPSTPHGELHELDLGRLDANGRLTATTGQRIELSCLPNPLPVAWHDPDRFHLALVVRQPDGSRLQIPGFYREPITLNDRGDDEIGVASGPGRFAVRFRPGQPGTHQLELAASWDGADARRWPLPELVVAGQPWDDMVRIDQTDPRFFSIGARIGEPRFTWPIGLNIRSVNDVRGVQRTGTRLTPPRGWAAYHAYLTRVAANGATAAEIWMSSWNLALEWRDEWRGYHGLNGYHLANAERIDRLLDHAYALGVRINLVVYNHGMGSTRTDREWHNSPFAQGNGGPVPQAELFYSHPAALAAQARLRRYLVARYADHPAVLGWKLWTEMNLTDGYKSRRGDVRVWHANAAAAWRELDVYDHPVTSHWAGDYKTPDRALVGQAETLDYVCIDAYHGRRDDRRGILLAQLLWDGRVEGGRGLGGFAKPLLVTEYGGNWNAAPIPQLRAEHHTGPWAALVSGYAGAPMLWWFEWVDQTEDWGTWAAIGRFLAGEDLRHPRARMAELRATSPAGRLWVRGWLIPDRAIFVYVLDQQWGYDGRAEPTHAAAELILDNARPGRIAYEWWDADRGVVVASGEHDHQGDRLQLPVPPFQRHIALKLRRLSSTDQPTQTNP